MKHVGPGRTLVTRPGFDGLVELEIGAGLEDLRAFLRNPRRPVVQEAFPELSDDEIEFLISGTMPGEWDELFEEDER